MTDRAVFLDRDGTLIEHVHHLHKVEDVRLVPGAGRALARLRAAGWLAVLATNQSVVGRGVLTESGLEEIHRHLEALLLAEGGSEARLDAIYWNPHCPPEDGSDHHQDRKPNPGMLLSAAEALDIELSESWMVGDAITDVEAGHRAGCRGSILVKTGQQADFEAIPPERTSVVPDVVAAIDLILGESVSLRAAQVDLRARASDD